MNSAVMGFKFKSFMMFISRQIILCCLLLPALYKPAAAQHNLIGKTYVSSEDGGLCSRVIMLISDSVYTYNYGCESKGHTYYGKYHIQSDTIIFKKGIIDPDIRITGIDSAAATGDNILEFRFIDQHGNNLSKSFKAGFKRANGFNYSLSYDTLKDILFYPKISNEKVSIYTLKSFGVKAGSVNADTTSKRSYTYHLNIPDYITRLDLFNKDILSEGETLVMIIRPEQLIQYVTESPSFYIIPNEGKIVYDEIK